MGFAIRFELYLSRLLLQEHGGRVMIVLFLSLTKITLVIKIN